MTSHIIVSRIVRIVTDRLVPYLHKCCGFDELRVLAFNKMRDATRYTLAAILPIAAACHCLAAEPVTLTQIYSFGSGPNTPIPVWQAPLLSDGSGGFYGATVGGRPANGPGAVFHLAPPAAGTGNGWTETVLYTFTGGADGSGPMGGLVMDAKGNLYGTSFGGTATAACPVVCGLVFQLAPPATGGGVWTENVLYSFTGAADGATPNASLAIDQNGALYGAAYSGGASPTVCGYGVAPGCGVVFQLAPPGPEGAGGAWTYKVLHSFLGGTDGAGPAIGVIFGNNGVLYGIAGAVFQLSPPTSPEGAWTKATLYWFGDYQSRTGNNPSALVLGPGGTLYGATFFGGNLLCSGGNGCGVVYSLAPPASAGAGWTYTVLFAFPPTGYRGVDPYVLISIKTGELFGLSSGGKGRKPSGTIFRLKPPASPGGTWVPATVWTFEDVAPYSLMEMDGALYGTAAIASGSAHHRETSVVFQVTF
jgi:hypothetical protein